MSKTDDKKCGVRTMPKYKLVYQPDYDLWKAQYTGDYYLLRLKRSIFGKEKYVPVKTIIGLFGDPIDIRGDKRWAKMIAIDFNIEVPEEKKGKL